jgi:hypothetical protein
LKSGTIKEFQILISMVCLQDIYDRAAMNKREMAERMFVNYHGEEGRGSQIERCINGEGLYANLWNEESMLKSCFHGFAGQLISKTSITKLALAAAKQTKVDAKISGKSIKAKAELGNFLIIESSL